MGVADSWDKVQNIFKKGIMRTDIAQYRGELTDALRGALGNDGTGELGHYKDEALITDWDDTIK